MSDDKPIDVETVPADPETSQALTVRERGGAVGKPLTVEELHARLEFIRQVMRTEMKEGTDYGKIPGCGDKPGLFQPGAQKLLMTFNLREQVRKETLREYPGMHREYEITVTVFPAGSSPEQGWDGVGTCSTLESKYRYRKAERRCPSCGKNCIIQGKAEFGGGWLCWKKKGGCGATFAENDPKITSQPGGTTENEDPADAWNTVRKMAFKRALVAASINATNTSELWTQDLEDMSGNEGARRQPTAAKPADKPAPKPPPQTSAKPVPKHWKRNEQTLKWVIGEIKARPGQPFRAIATEFLRKVGPPTPLMPNEEIEQLDLRWCPVTPEQLELLKNCIGNFEAGGDAVLPYPPFDPDANESAPAPKPTGETAATPNPTASPTQTGTTAKTAATTTEASNDPEWWREVIIPIPPKGVRLADYRGHEQTIGALYDLRHGGDDEAEAARQRLWGFVHNYDPKPREFNGKVYQPTAADFKFREALDAFAEYWEREHPGEKL